MQCFHKRKLVAINESIYGHGMTSCLQYMAIFMTFMFICIYDLYDHLTRNRGGTFCIHRKIGCLNFEPQYLLNYSSPKNDLYSVRKRSIRAFKSIFKLHWLRNLRKKFARVVPMLTPVG